MLGEVLGDGFEVLREDGRVDLDRVAGGGLAGLWTEEGEMVRWWRDGVERDGVHWWHGLAAQDVVSEGADAFGELIETCPGLVDCAHLVGG